MVVKANVTKAKQSKDGQEWIATVQYNSGRRLYSRPLVSQQGHELDHPVLQVRLPAQERRAERGRGDGTKAHQKQQQQQNGASLSRHCALAINRS